MMLSSHFYRTARGDEPVRQYLDKIPENDAAGILAGVDMLCRVGWLEMPHGRPLSGHKGLFEIRYRRHRVLYTVLNSQALMLHAFAKKSRKTPRKEIEVALKRIKSFG